MAGTFEGPHEQDRTHQGGNGRPRRTSRAAPRRARGVGDPGPRPRRPAQVVRPVRAQHRRRAFHDARQGHPGQAERGPGRDDGRHRRGVRPRRHRLHDAPVLPDPLDHAGQHPRDLPSASSASGMTTTGACGDITRNVVGCTSGRPRPRRGRRRLRHVRGDPRVLPRQQALLEPPAQVQGLRHGLLRGLRARPDQRHRALRRDRRGRHARLQPARRRRPLAPSPASRAGWTSSSRPRRPPRSSPR